MYTRSTWIVFHGFSNGVVQGSLFNGLIVAVQKVRSVASGFVKYAVLTRMWHLGLSTEMEHLERCVRNWRTKMVKWCMLSIGTVFISREREVIMFPPVCLFACFVCHDVGSEEPVAHKQYICWDIICGPWDVYLIHSNFGYGLDLKNHQRAQENPNRFLENPSYLPCYFRYEN